MKHLWEYDNKALFETDPNHKAKQPYYESWQEFLELSKNALKCNCTYFNPLVWWYWEVRVEETKDYDPDETYPKEDHHDKLTLIYGQWFSKISKFVIKVDKTDELAIREFIKEHQKLTRVD
jgi:hypothetical protein